MKTLNFIRLIILIFNILLFNTLKAQKPDLQFEKLTDKSGRSLGFVTGIVQDNNGYLWISTRKGLFKYDGYNYTLFRNKAKDSSSLPFNDITKMYLDKQNNLWLRHYDQFAVMSNEKLNNQFKSITEKHYAVDSKICDDKQGNIWISTSENGLIKTDLIKNKFTIYKKQNSLYVSTLFKSVDSLFQKNKPFVEIIDVKNNANIKKEFSIKSKTNFLIVSIGEVNNTEIDDFGYIQAGSNEIWTQNPALSKHAGGHEHNKIQIHSIVLPAGKYTLGYISNQVNASNDWKKAEAPDKLKFYGVKLIAITESEKSKFNSLIAKNEINENTISNNDIKEILNDNNGRMAIVSSDAIDIYVAKENKFINIPFNFEQIFSKPLNSEFNINCAYQSKSGDYWLGTSDGLIKYEHKNQQLHLFRNALPTDTLLTGNNITCILEDSHNKLWIGTDKGLNLYLPKNNTFYKYTADNKNRMYDNQIYAIYEDKGQNIWLASVSGLNKLRKSRFTYIDLKTDIISNYPILVQNKDQFWYHGENNLFVNYNRTDNSYHYYPLSPAIFPFNLTNNEKWYFFNHLASDQYQQIWIAIHKGAYHFNKSNNTISDFIRIPPIEINGTQFDDMVRFIQVDVNNHLWLFSQTSVYEYNISTTKSNLVASFDRKIEHAYEIDNFIKNIIKDKKGNFWIRTATGIYFIDYITKKIKVQTQYSPEILGTSVADGNIFEDNEGLIWYAIMPDLYQFNPKTKKTKKISLSKNTEVGNCFTTKDSNNNIWVYTDNGLFKLDKMTNEIRQFTNEDGLADNNINGFFDDNRRSIWITSSKGITRFDKKSETFENLSSEFINSNFTSISDINLSKNGEILFFTNKGFYSFFPDSINKNKPKLGITKLLISDKEINITEGISDLKLAYKDNSITFEFSALDFTDPANNQYSYILEGFNKEWQTCDANNRKAVYTNLDPKTYVFKLKGSNNDQYWNEEGIQISIIIKPPFYRTILFYIICAIVIFWIVMLIIKWREKKLQKEKRILEQKVEERTIELEEQKKELKIERDLATQHRDEIAAANKNITDSIHYASRIQSAILPPLELIEKILPEFFILYKPRDIVSGDFYWLLEKDSKIIIAAADCTGHGVPGAFMSMLGIAFLNEIVNKKEIYHPNEILNELKNNVIKSLHQTGRENEAKDGMDIALCTIDLNNMVLEFSGAYNPLLVIRNSELIQVKADHMPIGIHSFATTGFTNNIFELQKNDSIYLFSDGYVDQFGGPNQRKFMIKNFKTLLLSIQELNMQSQKELLNENIENWRGETDQIDDILVIGVKIN